MEIPFEVVRDWEGESELIEEKHLLGTELRHIPEMFEIFNLSIYPYTITSVINNVKAEIVEDENLNLYLVLKGTAINPIKKRAAYWRMLLWWGIIVPIKWFTILLHSVLDKTFNEGN
jgi:hypothetical protein